MISSPYCAYTGFVFIFVLNLLIRYTSVIAYMKFFSPPFSRSLSSGMLDELKRRFGITSRFFYSSLLFGKDLAFIMKKKVSLSRNFILASKLTFLRMRLI